MSGKRILIVSSHGLFREGLKRTLAEKVDLAFAKHTTSVREAEELLGAQEIDVVIVDQSDDQIGSGESISLLLSYPGVRVITVKPNSGDLWIHRQQR
jgi:DNA-binding NarL/FixJ family response regulator